MHVDVCVYVRVYCTCFCVQEKITEVTNLISTKVYPSLSFNVTSPSPCSCLFPLAPFLSPFSPLLLYSFFTSSSSFSSMNDRLKLSVLQESLEVENILWQGRWRSGGGGEQRKVFMKAKKHCILLAYGEKCQVICVRWAPKPYLKCQPASQPTQIRVISPLQMLGPYCPPVRKHKGKEEKAFAFQVSLSKAFSLANIRVAAQCLHDNLQDCSRQKSDIGVPLPLLV